MTLPLTPERPPSGPLYARQSDATPEFGAQDVRGPENAPEGPSRASGPTDPVLALATEWGQAEENEAVPVLGFGEAAARLRAAHTVPVEVGPTPAGTVDKAPAPTDLRARITEAIWAADPGTLTETVVQEITYRVLPVFAWHMVRLSGELRARADALATQATELETTAPAPVVPKACCGRRIGHYPTCRANQAGPVPDDLRALYAAALEAADYRPDMQRGDLADAVMRVRDRRMEQLEAGRETWKRKAEEIEQARDQLATVRDREVEQLREMYAEQSTANARYRLEIDRLRDELTAWHNSDSADAAAGSYAARAEAAERQRDKLWDLLGEAVDWIHEGELRERICDALNPPPAPRAR